MRRGVVMIIIGAVALGLVVTVAVLSGVVLPRLRQDPEPPPDYAPGERTPEESTVVVRPKEDGTVHVIQLLTSGAGPGTDHPLTFYLGGTRLGHSDTVRYAVLPQVESLAADDQTSGGDRRGQEIEVEESGYADSFTDGRRYRLSAPGGRSPGRHRVGFRLVLSDVCVKVEGERVLAVPLRFASGPDTGQPADQVRLTVNGAVRLDCPDGDGVFADRQTCGEGEVLNYRPAAERARRPGHVSRSAWPPRWSWPACCS